MGLTHSVHQLYSREKINSPDKLFRLKACIDEMKSSFVLLIQVSHLSVTGCELAVAKRLVKACQGKVLWLMRSQLFALIKMQ